MGLAEPTTTGRPVATHGGRRRLRICYLVPGHGLLSTVGPSRNVLSLARALSAYAEVTVAFRYRLEDHLPAGLELVELEPERRPAHAIDDAAMRGMGLLEFARYLARLRRFLRESRGRFDVFLEKSWILSGHLSAYGLGRGIPGVPVENVVPSAARHVDAGLAKRLRVELGRRLAGPALRRVPVVLAETEQLKAQIERTVLSRVREVTRYIEPEVTVNFAIAAVPDAVFDLCSAVQAEALKMNVVVIGYSMFVPYLLLAYQTILRSSQQVDLQKLGAYIEHVQKALKAIQEELEGRFSRALTMLGNSREEMRMQMGRVTSGLLALQATSAVPLEASELGVDGSQSDAEPTTPAVQGDG